MCVMFDICLSMCHPAVICARDHPSSAVPRMPAKQRHPGSAGILPGWGRPMLPGQVTARNLPRGTGSGSSRHLNPQGERSAPLPEAGRGRGRGPRRLAGGSRVECGRPAGCRRSQGSPARPRGQCTASHVTVKRDSVGGALSLQFSVRRPSLVLGPPSSVTPRRAGAACRGRPAPQASRPRSGRCPARRSAPAPLASWRAVRTGGRSRRPARR